VERLQAVWGIWSKAMESDQAIRERLAELKASRGDYRDPGQLKEVDVQIGTLEWVLELGPEVVIVPKRVGLFDYPD
jgi:hypothetical protein